MHAKHAPSSAASGTPQGANMFYRCTIERYIMRRFPFLILFFECGPLPIWALYPSLCIWVGVYVAMKRPWPKLRCITMEGPHIENINGETLL